MQISNTAPRIPTRDFTQYSTLARQERNRAFGDIVRMIFRNNLAD